MSSQNGTHNSTVCSYEVKHIIKETLAEKVSQVSPSSFVLDGEYNPSDRLRIQAMLAGIKNIHNIKASNPKESQGKPKESQDNLNVSLGNLKESQCDVSLHNKHNESVERGNSDGPLVEFNNKSAEEITVVHKPHSCGLCGKNFSTKSCLERHRKTHSDEKHHACGTCNKVFTRIDHLRSHRKRNHCRLCDRCFSRNIYLIKHQRIHNGKKYYIVVCNM